jgi:hypothetical protein
MVPDVAVSAEESTLGHGPVPVRGVAEEAIDPGRLLAGPLVIVLLDVPEKAADRAPHTRRAADRRIADGED